MAGETIPKQLRAFLLRHILSVTQLEALLLLYENPEKSWTVAETTARLYARESDVAEMLARLAADGFLAERDGAYRYACDPPELHETVTNLAAFYRQHLIPVTNLIHQRPRGAISFAEAFRFRKPR